jgi:hypothetical protein
MHPGMTLEKWARPRSGAKAVGAFQRFLPPPSNSTTCHHRPSTTCQGGANGRAVTFSACFRCGLHSEAVAWRVILRFTFVMQFFGALSDYRDWGTAMDNTALDQLIAQIRSSKAALAEAEQNVAALKNEFAQQECPKPAPLRTVEPMPKRVDSGWQFVA